MVFIDTNVKFLQGHHVPIGYAMFQRYLQCGTWIKRIRAAATENKKRVTVDPYTFIRGVKEKKGKIFLKYNKILKEIIEMMKVGELKHANKLSVMAEAIASEMKEICTFVEEIVREEVLLELEFYPGEGKAD
mgnify:CR=1 FL=1